MRVTNKMLSNNFLRDMRLNLRNMSRVQEQMTSGKEIRRPSDDPFKSERIMQLYTEIDTNKQYNENISDIINWMDTTDTALNQAGNVLQRVRELLISSGNAGYGKDELRAIKDEVNEKIGQFSQVLNTNFDGSYIFGGTRSTTKPVDAQKSKNDDGTEGNIELFYYGKDGEKLEDGSVELNKINKKLSVQISQGVSMEYNVNASEIIKYGTDSKDDLRELFTRITNHLDSKDKTDTKELINKDLDDITKAMDNILKVRAEVGAKQNRMDDAKNRNIDQNFNMTEILSKTEDIDLTEKTMEFAIMRTVYMASLQTSAKVIQPTLMDYLR